MVTTFKNYVRSSIFLMSIRAESSRTQSMRSFVYDLEILFFLYVLRVRYYKSFFKWVDNMKKFIFIHRIDSSLFEWHI